MWLSIKKMRIISIENNSKLGQETLVPTTGTEGTIPLKPILVKIDLSNIKDEICYWETAMVCFVVGANQPLVLCVEYGKP